MGSLKTLGSCNIDLKKQSRHIRPSNRLYWPCTTEYDRPFGNIETIIFIIVSRHVRKSFMIRQVGTDDSDDDDKIKTHKGAILNAIASIP